MAEQLDVTNKKQVNKCILLCGRPCSKIDSLDKTTSVKWSSIQEKALKWKDINPFSNIHSSVDWEKGPKEQHMHNACYATLSSNTYYSKAKRRTLTTTQSVDDDGQEVTELNITQEASEPKKLRSDTGRLHDKSCCVWCMKGQKFNTFNRDKQILLLSTLDAWTKFKVHTVRLVDEPMRERLSTLIDSIPDAESAFGIEIRYHRACWRKYISDQKPLTDEAAQHLQRVSLREAQALFFSHVRQVIFHDHEFRTLQGLVNDYTRIISNYGHTSIVRSSYLKMLLVNEFGDTIGFHERQQKNVSELVYDTTAGGTYIEAAISSLGVSNDQLIKNIASRIKQDVIGTDTVAWPPYILELEKEENTSELLMKLISWMKRPNMSDIDDTPTVRSIVSLVTSYITGKRTAFCTNISVMLHGLSKSREIVDIIHKNGLGISYNDTMMLRDFWVVNDLKRSLNCPFELADGTPAIAIVDNDDFKSDTLTGAGQPHRTNVMFIQPESLDKDISSATHQDRPVHTTKLAATLSAELNELGREMRSVRPYKTLKRGEPPIRKQSDDNLPDTSAQRTRGVIHELTRSDDDHSRPHPKDQSVPVMPAFHANMSEPDKKSRAIYHMTYPDPPSKTILYDVMSNLAKSVNEKEMPFAIIVGDHPVYVLLLELKSENPDPFSKLLPFMGPFHIQMSFIYAMYKRFKGSGLSDVLVAAGVIAEGSVDQALRGKHFKRGVRCLRLFYETLIHHALDRRLRDVSLSNDIKVSLDKLRQQVDADNVELADAYTELENNEELKILVGTLFEDCDDAPLAEYWISFMEMVEILTQNIHAIRTSNWGEFKSSLKLMLPWMQVYDNDRYGRYLPDFTTVLDNLTDEQAAFMDSGLFAQSMTGNPYSCVALDIWIESTMNKGSKLKSGWLGILNNEKQLIANTRNVNNVNRVRASVHRHADHKVVAKVKHADSSASKLKKDEQAIQDIHDCLTEFTCDPFDLTNQTLRSLQSGIPASEKLAGDFKTAHADGITKMTMFLQDRVFSKTKCLTDRVPRSNRQNFSKQELKKSDGERLTGKTADMESKAMTAVLGLVENSGALKLEEVLQHRVTDECLPIFNVNGTMRKVQKSKLQEKLTMTIVPEPELSTSIVDMGLIWHLAAPTTEDREKGDGSKYTWGDYGEKVFNLILARHKHADQIICINDAYDQKYSIKDSERILRQKGTPISNVYMKSEDKFPSIKDFHALLRSPGNKIRLQAFLQTSFERTVAKTNIQLIYCVVGGIAKNLTTATLVPEFQCSHTEADTAMFTIYNILRSQGCEQAVVLDTEDTDNYVQAAYVAQQTSGLLCVKRKREIISARCLCNEEMAASIIQLHVLTGCDHNSGFYGVSKKLVADRVNDSKEARDLLASCGMELPVTEYVLNDLELFVIRYIYNDPKSTTLCDARSAKWRSMKKKNTIRLAPDTDSLRPHLERANYLAYLQRHFDLLSHPSPIGNGWQLKDGVCLPVRYTQSPLPLTICLPVCPSKDPDEDSDTDTDSCNDSDCSSSENSVRED